MVRPRTALLGCFPDGTVSAEEASEALRQHRGDFEAAKKAISAKLNNNTDDAATRTKTNGFVSKEASNVPPETRLVSLPERLPPQTVAAVNNLSDRQYCCVWHVEVFEDGYRPEVARSLLARVARHVNPILRERGWRVKRLIESAASSWIGLCTTNGRDDADAASANIQLNLRTSASKYCQTFRTFEQVLSVMLHEITHISIGLEDIHPPAFYELLREIRQQYYEKLENGQVALETDDYGCKNIVVTQSGELKTVEEAARDTVRNDNLGRLAENGECGARKRRRWRGGRKRYGKGFTSNGPKRRPLLKGAKMVDGRTKAAKQSKQLREEYAPQEMAALAALARFEQSKADDVTAKDSSSEAESGGEDKIAPHTMNCGCRSCAWDKLLFR